MSEQANVGKVNEWMGVGTWSLLEGCSLQSAGCCTVPDTRNQKKRPIPVSSRLVSGGSLPAAGQQRPTATFNPPRSILFFQSIPSFLRLAAAYAFCPDHSSPMPPAGLDD